MIRATMLALAASIVGCTNDRCDFTEVHDYPSPNGRIALTAFEYCRYNTTGYDTHLQLRSSGAKLRAPGNICTIPFAQEFTVAWRSPSNVVIGLRGPIPEPTNVAGIAVTFAKLPPMN